MSKKDWSKGRLLIEMERFGIETFAGLEDRLKLPPGTVSATIVKPFLKGEEPIADFLGVSPAVIWPSRYDENGVRLKPQPTMNYIRRALTRHGQKGRAA